MWIASKTFSEFFTASSDGTVSNYHHVGRKQKDVTSDGSGPLMGEGGGGN